MKCPECGLECGLEGEIEKAEEIPLGSLRPGRRPLIRPLYQCHDCGTEFVILGKRVLIEAQGVVAVDCAIRRRLTS